MAPSSPEPVSKKRKDSISHLKRDQPLFASRRFAPSQQAPDFFTESLNTSYAPSPSPARSPSKRQNGQPATRNASGSGHSLAAVFKATSNNSENQRPSTLPSFDQNHPLLHYDSKPRSNQNDVRPRSSPANPVLGQNERTRTPSPARGRQLSIVSPVSSQHSQSSPPRGLAEAYQRIVDEESLAQEESADDQMDAYGYDFAEDAEETEMLGLNGAPDPMSPTSLKASRKASRENTPMGDYLENKENTLHGSANESQRSSLDNITDRSLDSAISQHNKDAQRLDGALRSNVKIFSKARLGEKVGLTVENLRRKNASAESLGSAFGENLSSRGSDPSLNLPKAWGRKAQPSKDWLSRINSKSGRLTGDVPKKQKADSPIIAESENRDWDEPIDSWIQAAADVPLPSKENGSSQTPRTSSQIMPKTAHGTSRGSVSGWNVNADFTEQSLQVPNSPPIRIRSRSPDERRNREIGELERRGLTRNRLGEIRTKSSVQQTRENQATPQGSKRSSSRSSIEPGSRRRESHGGLQATIKGDGEQIPDTPVVVYKNNSDSSESRKSGRKEDRSQRPQHERHDSRDILQRLARATSASPASSTGASKTEAPQPHQPSHTDDDSERQRASEPASTKSVDETPQPSKSSTRLKTPQVTGAWVDGNPAEETPGSSMPNVNLKTPLVTGAWVDTPLPAGGRGPPMPTPNVEDDKDFILEGNELRKLATSDLIKKLSPKSDSFPAMRNTSRPLPKSALESVLNAAKASLESKPSPHFASNSDSDEDPPLHLGESTVQSLEEIFANDTSFPSPPSPPASGEDSSSPTTSLKPYSRQLSRLNSLLPSIRDARKHISQLERAVASNSKALTTSPSQNQDVCTEAGEFHDFIWPCERCGCSSGGRPPTISKPLPSLITFHITENLTTLTLPIPRLWRWDHPESWRPRLTWLGLILLWGWIWWVAEGVMCDIYCHPRYAWTMEGYGVDINAPEPPFVLEKMLWRWMSLDGIIRPVYVLLRAVVRLGAQIVGYLAGVYMGDGAASAEVPVRQPVSTDPRIPRPEYGPDLSMYDDEYL